MNPILVNNSVFLIKVKTLIQILANTYSVSIKSSSQIIVSTGDRLDKISCICKVGVRMVTTEVFEGCCADCVINWSAQFLNKDSLDVWTSN